ncbi:hypothetical protein BOTBODRAFT_167440 [Botryobasidium botryosum FD-172 SS1]|uniref:SH3 domain-containing protein n=1 Tax=Botryobasidium botryosum (strain FD-172 SS1) TaxID=930990 RepID=A0A067M537_BOTB1|nr:hypothetical protein BOTBODRAFT_167440 [Botryobasidium botryosum FD-172 SS1]
MKSLRRSLNTKDHHHHQHHPSISSPISHPPLSKPVPAVVPPKIVIRALVDYHAASAQELSFSKGDFFYVISDSDRGDGWYEAHNPVSGSRGLVPRSGFEVFTKGASIGPRAAALSNPPAVPKLPPIPRLRTFYAIVQFDFTAERPDELDARAGEPISVVAQSNREWFVAKPIGRLGGPGLIPVSFVEIRDPSSGRKMEDEEVEKLMERGELPRVEEWKKATLEYKASSIPLGVLDVEPSDTPSTRSPQSPTSPPQPDDMLPRGVLTAATIPSFHYENNEYWFRLNASYQPNPEPSTSSPSPLPLARQLVLYRNYDDFYDFQINLLDQFPVEAGRNGANKSEEDESSRILPYMPGPVNYVDDIVTAHRRKELDDYLNQLCALSQQAEYILRCDLIRMFFSPRAGDLMEMVEDRVHVVPPRDPDHHPNQNGAGALEKDFEGLRVDDLGHSRQNSASDYGADDDERRVSSQFGAQPHRYSDRGPIGGAQPTMSRSASPDRRFEDDDEFDSPHMTHDGTSGFYPSQPPPPKTHSRSQSHTHQQLPVTHPYQSQHARSRSNTSSPMPPTPPPSGSAPAPTFLKIKIFHSNTDDLIAIRVPPRVTYTQLLSKVRERLGSDVTCLRYRDSWPGGAPGSNGDSSWHELNGDDELREWVGKEDKLVLYAD